MPKPIEPKETCSPKVKYLNDLILSEIKFHDSFILKLNWLTIFLVNQRVKQKYLKILLFFTYKQDINKKTIKRNNLCA